MRRFHAASTGFEVGFAAFLAEQRGASGDVQTQAQAIVEAVHKRGGEAVVEYTRRFDRLELDAATLQSSHVQLDALAALCPAEVREAIDVAHTRIEAYHRAIRPSDGSFDAGKGVRLAWRWTAVDAVGVYVPGGRASYPSSALMNIVPAKVAGVSRIVMVAPAPDGKLNPAVAYAALRAGVQEFYPMGGAQAVAALAYGAGPLKPVDKIVGPGNAYVAAAKRIVFGKVGLDTIAGPSEITVVADGSVSPDWVAADLLSQAEHDPAAQSILISDDPSFIDAVLAEVERLVATLSTASVARASLASHGAAVEVASLQADAASLVDLIAPEHVQIMTRCDEALVQKIRHAGAVFVGPYATEALGDYVTGSNHVLPTYGAARFASGLSTMDFMKRTSVQRVSADGFRSIAGAAHTLAETEGLAAHALAVSLRQRALSDL